MRGNSPYNIEDYGNKKVFDREIFRKLGGYARPYKGGILLISLIIVITVACEVSIPLISRYVIDSFITKSYSISHLEKIPQDLKGLDEVKILDGGSILYPKGYEDNFSNEVRKGVIANRDSTQYFMGSENLLKGKISPNYIYKDQYILSSKQLESLDEEILSSVRGRDIDGITRFSIIFIGVIILSFISTYLQIYFTAVTGQKIIYDIRMDIFKHMERMPIKFFDSNPTGVLVTRVTNDINNLNEFFSNVLVNLFKDIFVLAGIFSVLYITDWRLALVTTAVIPIILFISFTFKHKMREVFRWSRKALAHINAILSETITGMGVIQLFNQEKSEEKRFYERNLDHYKASYKQMFLNSIFRPTFSVLRFSTIGVVLYFASGYITIEVMTIGTLVAFIAYIEKFFQPIQEISEKINLMQSAMASSEKIFDLMELETEDFSDNDTSYSFGTIEFKDVYFAYNGKEWILKDFNLTINRGESVAIVGSTGAGKTTIINILNRFYPISRGDVTIDGVSIYDIPLDKVRAMIGLVQQDPFIFSGSIGENITLGEDVSREELDQLARSANSSHFIQKLPNSYDEDMKEGGSNISVGEKQLVAFTRVMAFNPQLLILDEATSSVDTETEVLIQNSIEELQKNRTSIVIAHRLSTIRNCDKIIVLHKGKIMEEGSHDDLIDRKDLYYKLYKLQYS
jgi:ATP-binding cassette subfamily B protein/subfamily B ATP-binding cassette protein MsbA